ncbi:MAG: hypothetical protein WBM50_01940 [Acidimicrobiales bacterium]
MNELTRNNDSFLSVRFPAVSGFLRLSRLNATAFASSLGFDVDALDDLRLAVDEAVTWLMNDEEAGGSITLTMSETVGAPGLQLIAERTGDGLAERPVGELVHAIFGATVDSYRFDAAAEPGRRRSVRLEKFVGGAE